MTMYIKPIYLKGAVKGNSEVTFTAEVEENEGTDMHEAHLGNILTAIVPEIGYWK